MAFVLFRTIRNMNQNKTYLTTKEAAEYLGVDPRTILKRIERGELKAEKIGKSWRVQASSLFNETETVPNDSERMTRVSETIPNNSELTNQLKDEINRLTEQLETKDQQIEKLQQALDQEQQLNAISQRNVENLSNKIESQRLQLDEYQRPKPLIARLKAVFVAE